MNAQHKQNGITVTNSEIPRCEQSPGQKPEESQNVKYCKH
jgi:hypothetical protein